MSGIVRAARAPQNAAAVSAISLTFAGIATPMEALGFAIIGLLLFRGWRGGVSTAMDEAAFALRDAGSAVFLLLALNVFAIGVAFSGIAVELIPQSIIGALLTLGCVSLLLGALAGPLAAAAGMVVLLPAAGEMGFDPLWSITLILLTAEIGRFARKALSNGRMLSSVDALWLGVLSLALAVLAIFRELTLYLSDLS